MHDPRPHSLFFLIYREDPAVLFVDRQACRPAVSLLYRGGFSSHARPEKIFSAHLRDRCQKKQWIRGLSAILIPVFLPFLLYGLFAVSEAFSIPYGNFLLNLLVYSVLPCHTAIIDGGTATLLGGVILYLTHRHRKLQAGAFALFVLAWDILPVLLFIPAGTSASFFFTDAYEWLEVFAVIPMLCYNGTRGHGSKKLFYWFYPTHIYVLYALSFLLYLTLYGMGS